MKQWQPALISSLCNNLFYQQDLVYFCHFILDPWRHKLPFLHPVCNACHLQHVKALTDDNANQTQISLQKTSAWNSLVSWEKITQKKAKIYCNYRVFKSRKISENSNTQKRMSTLNLLHHWHTRKSIPKTLDIIIWTVKTFLQVTPHWI